MERRQMHDLVEVNPNSPEATLPGNKAFWVTLDLVAVLLWSFAIVKLFVFDVDVYIVSLINPSSVWLLNYKLPILSGLIVVAMLSTRSFMLGLAAAFVALYPFVILFWKFPRFVWKQQSWIFAFAILNAGIGFIRSFRRVFISWTLFLINAVVILSSGNQYVLSGSSFIILALVVLAYVLAFIRAFRPSEVFQTYTNLFPIMKKRDFLKVDESVRNMPVETMTAKQLELRTNGLQNVLLYNRACLLVSKKLRDYQCSGANVASCILGLVTLLLFVVTSFALINWALYKINPALYQFTYSRESIFAFIYYSAGSMFYTANGLVPVEPLSQAVHLLQFLFAVLLLVILGTLLFSLRNERYSTELEQVIDSVEKEGRAAEALLLSEFNLGSIESAIDALQKTKAGMINFIIYLTNNLAEEKY
jgi:hypothetical protein